MKKIIIAFTFILLFFGGTKIVSASSIIPPDDEESYSSVDDMPFPENSILGEAVLLQTKLVSGQTLNGKYYKLYRYEIPIYCLVDLCGNSAFCNLIAGSSSSISFVEEITATVSYSQQIATEHSLSVSGSLGNRLGFSNVGMDTTIDASVSSSITQSYGSVFSYSTTSGRTHTITYNVDETGHYRLEKRAFLYVYVIQTYSIVSSSNFNFNFAPLANINLAYYFHGNSVRLGLIENGNYEIGMMKYNHINGEYTFDKDYYATKFNNGNTDFLVL